MGEIEQTAFYKDIYESFNRNEVSPSDAVAALEYFKYILLCDTAPKTKGR